MNASTADAGTSVVVDTTAYLPDETIAELGIHRISLYVTLDGVEKRESEIDAAEYDDFYERLRKSSGGATTSQPSVGDFTAVYEPLLANGGDVVSIHLSAGISGTYESASLARQSLIDEGKGGERIHVYDSRSACGGAGFVAIAAARAANSGASGAEALAAAERAAAASRCGSQSTPSSTCERAGASALRRRGWAPRFRSSRS